ncbi:MAG: hypothetical protein QOK31_180 [Solirubrobacteraceae bacterium]|nr:hypothetical protein [Solirubrobacteraceae bacterium]
MNASDDRGDLLEALRSTPAAKRVLDALAAHQGVYLVGGAVRDLLLGGRPVDLDFVVEGDAAPVATDLANRLGGTARAYEQFGTASVSIGPATYDLARARTETYAEPGALPVVSPAGLDADLRRRDFTVNAIALAVAPPEPGRLTAAPLALEDLAARRLRVLHDASFQDDPTRLMRLARYGARLGFELEERTGRLAGEAVRSGALSTVSGPRVGQELRLAAREADWFCCFARLAELGLDAAIHPRFGLDRSLAEDALTFLPADGRPDIVVLAAACRHLLPEEVSALLDRLGFDRAEAAPARALVGRLQQLASALGAVRRASEIDALLSGSTPEEAALVAALGPRAQACRWLGELRGVRLEIDGDDLRRAGIGEGPAVGAALAAARAGRLDGELMTREAQLEAALRIASQ